MVTLGRFACAFTEPGTGLSELDAATTAALVAAVLAFSPLASGYYAFTAWAPLTLGAVVLLVLLALVVRPRFALATVTALVLAGVLLGTYEGVHTTRQTEQARYLSMVAPDSLR